MFAGYVNYFLLKQVAKNFYLKCFQSDSFVWGRHEQLETEWKVDTSMLVMIFANLFIYLNYL